MQYKLNFKYYCLLIIFIITSFVCFFLDIGEVKARPANKFEDEEIINNGNKNPPPVSPSTKPTYTVYYYNNCPSWSYGATTASVTGDSLVVQGGPLSSCCGYSFAGWYTSSAGGTEKKGAVNENLWLYAHWVGVNSCYRCNYYTNYFTQVSKFKTLYGGHSELPAGFDGCSNYNGISRLWSCVGFGECSSSGSVTSPEQPPIDTNACYVCKNNSVIKTVRKWGIGEITDGDCSAGYVKDETISKDKCVPTTIPVNYCKVNTQTNKDLNCNASNSLDSICDKRTIVVDNVGYADVKIEQHGYISNVLNPTKTYAGGGFSFGVTYTNTIKWSYVGDKPNDTLHKAIVNEMNKKIKDYNSFISGINISEISFDGKNIDSGFLVKKCETSNKNKDYYNKELTVTCTFYIPDSILKSNWDVEYKAGTGNSVSNKYYTPTNIGNNYNYKIEAKIVGMNRITDASAKADGEKGKSWTGTWSSTIRNCNVVIYPLLYSNNNSSSDGKNKYNFIYRPIDIYNPFPNRNAGINWFEWYRDNDNRERLEDSYSQLQYSIEMNNKVITNIKNYNKNQGSYFDWDTMRNGNSTFIDSYFQIKRVNIVGDNS